VQASDEDNDANWKASKDNLRMLKEILAGIQRDKNEGRDIDAASIHQGTEVRTGDVAIYGPIQ